MARPRKHDRAKVMAAVCERIARGELVKDVAADLGVHPATVTEWGAADEFAEAYARAREAQAHALAESALSVADGVDPQTVAALEAIEAEELAADSIQNPQAKAAAKKLVASLWSNVVARDRMRMDARKWLASKIAPRHYGERQMIDLTRRDAPPAPSRLTEPERAEMLRRFLAEQRN